MTEEQADNLQRENAVELSKMDSNAAGMVQSLLLDLGSNDSFIRLESAQSHEVNYVFVEGTPHHVELIGRRLGLTITASTIKVPHG